MNRPILNIADAELKPRPPAQLPPPGAAAKFEVHTAFVSTRIGAQKLGYNLTAVPPGKRGYPFHSHRVNEEMFFILEGAGEVRIGKDVHAVRKGDIIACPAGGPETAHQIANTGTTELRYLAVSTLQHPEIADYPDSGKFGVFLRTGVAPDGRPQFFRFMGREAIGLDYWDGE